MKRSFVSPVRLAALVLSIVLFLTCSASAETMVASFYPVWLIALNLTDGIEEIDVRLLAPADTGCLHDYQLQTSDMRSLSSADLLLVNGAGMEAFLSSVYDAFPALPVVEASEGIPLLDDVSPVSIGESETEHNAHIWLDPSLAALMAENLAEGMISVMPEYDEAIRRNLDSWSARMSSLDGLLKEELAPYQGADIITFHEAFPYFARAYGLNVAAVINKEPGETPTPAQMAELIALISDLGRPPLFVEPQYEDISARTLAAETGAEVYTLDPVSSGPDVNPPLDYYETVMLQNMETLKTALGN